RRRRSVRPRGRSAAAVVAAAHRDRDLGTVGQPRSYRPDSGDPGFGGRGRARFGHTQGPAEAAGPSSWSPSGNAAEWEDPGVWPAATTPESPHSTPSVHRVGPMQRIRPASPTVLAFPGGCPGNGVADARVAEWQTRWLQVPVSARTWGFKSPLAHHGSLDRCETEPL